MIGVGPFIAHPDTPLATPPDEWKVPADRQVPASELMTYKTIALSRLVCPEANIPSTTALATLNKAAGRELGLRRGANVIMPNLTPVRYRSSYEIYPDKACINETPQQCHTCVEARIRAIGRSLGRGRGDSPNVTRRRATAPAARSAPHAADQQDSATPMSAIDP
jgi:biotin synthase